MTEQELAELIKKPKYKISKAIAELSKIMASLSKKCFKDKLYPNSELSWEEIEAICKELNCNTLQIMFVKEHFKSYTPPDIYEIEGTHKYLEKYKENPHVKCCNTCKYLIGVTGSHKMPQPYCKVYERFLESFYAKVYEDWCSSYTYIELSKPRQWFKDNAPINLNIYGDIGTINGIDNSKMMNSKRSVKGVVTRVNQIGFDE